MIERDDEDMWFECLAFAIEDFVPKNHANRYQRAVVLADKLYDACKAKTKKVRKADRDPQETVVQLK